MVWLLKTLKSLQSDLAGNNDSLIKVLDKTLVLLSTKDPLAFQAIQAMDQPPIPVADYNPNAEEEMEEVNLGGLVGGQY